MTARQPRRTREQWAEIIEQQSRSGETIRTFCKVNDVGLASFGKWKKKLAESSSLGSDSSSNELFKPVSVSEPHHTAPFTPERTTVTLSFGSTVTLTIETSEPTP